MLCNYVVQLCCAIYVVRRIPPSLQCFHYKTPKGMGITNTISRAELAAIAAAVIHGYSHTATDSLTSLHQIKKHLSHPNFHRHHIQGDVLKSIAKAIRQSPSPIRFFKVKSHAPVLLVMNMPTSFLLKSQRPPTPSLLTPPSEQQALKEIPSTTSTGLQKKSWKTKHKPIIIPIQQIWPILLPQNFWYLPNHRDALQAHKHFLHKLGNAKIEANYRAYYQTLIKDGTATTSNAYLTSSYVPFKTKCVMHYEIQSPYIIKNMRYCSNSQQVQLAPSAHKWTVPCTSFLGANTCK